MARTPTKPDAAPDPIATALEVVSNDTGPVIVDNTDAQPVEEAPVDTVEVELAGGLTQVNYI